MSGLRFALAAAVLAGCSTGDRSAGGGGIEIPNGVTVVAKDSLGQPVAGARVRVLAAQDWVARLALGGSPVLDSATTDAHGMVTVPSRPESFWIEFEGSAGSARLSSLDGATQVAMLAPTLPVDGQIPSGEPVPARMRLAGTSQVSSVDATGRFRFSKVIRGQYALIAEGIGSRSGESAGDVVVGSGGVEHMGIHIDTTGVLLDDFTDGDLAWSLRELFGYMTWWRNADVPVDSLPKVFGISTLSQAIQCSGNACWLGFTVSDSLPVSWANFGLELGQHASRLPSVAHLAAVRFKARGTGAWSLILATDSVGTTSTWSSLIALDTGWKTIRIPATEIRLITATSRSLPGNTRLRNLVFQTAGPGSLAIDDVVLEGVGLQDWVLP